MLKDTVCTCGMPGGWHFDDLKKASMALVLTAICDHPQINWPENAASAQETQSLWQPLRPHHGTKPLFTSSAVGEEQCWPLLQALVIWYCRD